MSLQSLINGIPPEVIASWPSPNYVDPVTRGWMPGFILAWQITSTLLVGGRFYLRAKKLAGAFGWDDLLIAIAWIFSVGESVCIWLDTEKYGLDRHVWDIHFNWLVGAALNGWLSQVFFVVSTVCTKLSVLLFYRRMIHDTLDRRWIWALRSALVFTASYGIAVTVTYLCTCIPMEAIWEVFTFKYTKEYKCLTHGNKLAISAGILSVVSDLCAVALPWAMLSHYNLGATKRQKIALYATFALGLLVSGAGCARAYYLWAINTYYDSTWIGFELFAWAIVETQLAIICACAPSLRVFFRQYLRDALSRGFSSVSHYAEGSKQPTRTSTHLSSSRAQRESRGFHELKELESGVHGVANPAPVIARSSHDIVRSETPPLRSAEEYTEYAIERLSRHGSGFLKANHTAPLPPVSSSENLALEQPEKEAVRNRNR